MVVINHVEKIAPSKITVSAPLPVKKEEVAKPESEAKRGRKAKDE